MGIDNGLVSVQELGLSFWPDSNALGCRLWVLVAGGWRGLHLMQNAQPSSAVGAGEERITEVRELYRVGNRRQKRLGLRSDRGTEAVVGQAGE